MIDPKLPGERLLDLAAIHGQWREQFDREDAAQQVLHYIAARIDEDNFEVERNGTEISIRRRHNEPGQ